MGFYLKNRVSIFSSTKTKNGSLFGPHSEFFSPSECQSSHGHAPHEDPQSHYDLPVNSHIPGHYDLPPVRRPPSPCPSPRRSPQWQRQSSRANCSLLLAPRLMKKRLILSLKIRAADHQHSRGEESVLPDEPLFTVDALLSTKHRPLVCAERYWRLRHRPVIQTEEPAGCVVTPAGLQLLLTPEGKTHQRIWWLKAATWECLCVWTLVNMLKYLFSTPFACCWCIFNGPLLSELDFSFVSLFRVFISSWISVRYIFNIFFFFLKAASAEKKDVLWQTKFYKQKKYHRFFFFNTWKPKWAAFYKSSCCVFSKNKCHLRTEVCFFKEMWLIAAVWRKLCKYRNEYIVSLWVLLKRSSSVQIKMLLWVS